MSRQDPPVAEWLRGKAQIHRRAAATFTTAGQVVQAEAHRLAAASIGDVAREVESYLADGAGS